MAEAGFFLGPEVAGNRFGSEIAIEPVFAVRSPVVYVQEGILRGK
jgi:hypothetical protein